VQQETVDIFEDINRLERAGVITAEKAVLLRGKAGDLYQVHSILIAYCTGKDDLRQVQYY
jgi:hypothetical protein